ncbi:MAG: thioesterase family protein, partial [Actinobacteria bacterium]|nr:thioesterase family protein [Actinomycetota bacterium]
FGTTSIIAAQDDKVISAATVSMHAPEESSFHRSVAPPSVGTPDDATPTDNVMMPFDIRVVNGVDLGAKAIGPPTYEMWLRADVPADAPLSTHQALLAHSTDLTIIGTALRPFEGMSQADSTVSLHTAVTSHSLWFHQPFVLNDWLLIAQEAPIVAGGRAFGRGDVFNAGGEIVASFAQESMIRSITTK